MSGAEDLARLTQTIDKTNELLLSPEVKMLDVGGGVMRPTNAMVMSNLATLLGGAMPYASVALGLSGTADGTNFSVLSSAQDEYVNVYRNEAGSAVFVDSYPNADAVRALSVKVQAVSEVVTSTNIVNPEVQILSVTDQEGGMHLELTSKRLAAEAFELSNDNSATIIGDEEGGIALYVDGTTTIVGGIEGERTDMPGYFVTDAEGAILPTPAGSEDGQEPVSPFANGLMFAPLIVTSDLRDQKIHVANMLPRRAAVVDVVAAVGSVTTSASDTGDVLTVSGQKYGASAVLNLRQKGAPGTRKFMNLTLKNVPVQTPPATTKILIIGDSICNRQGGTLLKQSLQALGVTAEFIGTLRGSAVASSSGDATGELGEARESWETGDFTYAITDRAVVVPAGEESAYMAMSKTDKQNRNPFLRLATGSDSAAVVRNGYVFDPSYYQSRFGLSTPDIVIQALGTNDVRDRTADTIYDHVLGNDTLIHSQIRAAWPNAKIIRCFPGTAVNVERNDLWASRYLPLVRAIQQSISNRGDAKTLLAPLWALYGSEVGYAFPTTGGAGADGFYTSDWADALHPVQASRLALFESLTPYVAAAAINLI